MNKKKIICLLLIVFLLSGCNVAFFQGTIQEENSNKQIKGNKGLTLSIQNTLPEEISGGVEIPIQFLIQNEGAYDLGNISEKPLKYYLVLNSDSNIQILDSDSNVQNNEEPTDGNRATGPCDANSNFRDTPQGREICNSLEEENEEPNIRKLNEDLVGVTQQRTIGGFTTESFNITTLSQPTLKKTATISGHLCYPYETKLEILTCLDSSLFNFDETSFCEAETQKFDSQGAPVAIKKIETNKLKKKTDGIYYSVKIYLEDVGKGVIIKEDKLYDHCRGDLSFELGERNLGLKTITPILELEGYSSYEVNECYAAVTVAEASCEYIKAQNERIGGSYSLDEVNECYAAITVAEASCRNLKVQENEERFECGSLKKVDGENYIECNLHLFANSNEEIENFITKEIKLKIRLPYGYQTGVSKTITLE